MKAALLTAFNSPLVTADIDTPRITGPHDVIIQVTGAGICGSDVHFSQGAFKDVLGMPAFPYVLGHENAGFVVEVGAAVTTVTSGDAVVVHPHISCGLCRACRRGDETFCEALRFPGIDGRLPGGFAEYLKTSERAVVKLPPGTEPGPMASLADAGLTAYHAVRRALVDLPADGVAVVIGLGGVGYFALQLLRLFSPAKIIVVDRAEDKLQDAADLGADMAITAGPDLTDRMLALSNGVGVDLVMDCVGVKPIPTQGIAMLRRGGVYSALGADNGEACCGTLGLTGRELTIRGNLVGTLGELVELVQIAARGRLRLRHTFYALQEAEKAMHDLRAGTIRGRAVLTPASTMLKH